MSAKDEIKFILRKLFDDGDDDRMGGASPVMVLNLNKLVWNYLRELAIAKGVDKQGWFGGLCKTNETYLYVSDALDILVDIARHKNYYSIKASEVLIDSYQEYLNAFLVELND